jgi:hypothetical protein
LGGISSSDGSTRSDHGKTLIFIRVFLSPDTIPVFQAQVRHEVTEKTNGSGINSWVETVYKVYKHQRSGNEACRKNDKPKPPPFIQNGSKEIDPA